MDSIPGSRGLLSSVRALGDGLIASVHDRLELVSIELQEEKQRLIAIFIWISSAIFAGAMAIGCLSIAIVYAFPESHRFAALLGLALVYLLSLTALILGFRRHLSREPRPLSATIRELEDDCSCIRGEN